MQFQTLFDRVRRHRDGVTPTRTIFKDDVDVLTRQILQPFGCGELQTHDRHIGRGALNRGNPARHFAHRNIAHPRQDPRLDSQVCLRNGAAQQGKTVLLFSLSHRSG